MNSENRLHILIKDKINLLLDGLSFDAKIKMLSDLIDSYEAADDKYRYIEMGPIWEEQVAAQNRMIKQLEKHNLFWKMLTTVLTLALIYIKAY